MSTSRRKTRQIPIGKYRMGGDAPILVQSMITEETRNIAGCVDQIVALAQAGCELVRVTTPTLGEAECLQEIRAQVNERVGDVPLTADVHHQGSAIAVEAAKWVDEVRVNPGLFVFRKPTNKEEFTEAEHQEERAAIADSLRPVIEACKQKNISMRVGVNHGSLAERMLVTYGDTPEGMVQSALEYIEICEQNGFHNINISAKASRVPIMLEANRLLSQRTDYPLHLGVTEAGDGQYARVKSTAGIATLLAEGIGDTIRVSLSEDPVNEISVCYDILQALGLRRTKTEFIACPSCGRTKFDLPTVFRQVKEATGHLTGLDIAIMGCIVNGPGEMADADYGYVGKAGGQITLYRKREPVMTVSQEQGVQELIKLIKADGNWVEPSDTGPKQGLTPLRVGS
ncbi:MAG: (E)-4-hydroxy-3-methylbut-2-enyl-diphosphate synthase [Fimbriimonadales bacterium]